MSFANFPVHLRAFDRPKNIFFREYVHKIFVLKNFVTVPRTPANRNRYNEFLPFHPCFEIILINRVSRGRKNSPRAMFGGNEKEEKKRAGEKRDTTTKNAIFFFYLFHRIDLESGNESDIKNRNFSFRVKPSSFIHSNEWRNERSFRQRYSRWSPLWLITTLRGEWKDSGIRRPIDIGPRGINI